MYVAKPDNEPDRWVLFYVTKKSIKFVSFPKVQNTCELNPNNHFLLRKKSNIKLLKLTKN